MVNEPVWDAQASFQFTPCNPTQAKNSITRPVVHDFQNLNRIKSKSPGRHACAPIILGPLKNSINEAFGGTSTFTSKSKHYGTEPGSLHPDDFKPIKV